MKNNTNYINYIDKFIHQLTISNFKMVYGVKIIQYDSNIRQYTQKIDIIEIDNINNTYDILAVLSINSFLNTEKYRIISFKNNQVYMSGILDINEIKYILRLLKLSELLNKTYDN